MSGRTPAKPKKVEPYNNQNALSEKAEFSKKMLAQGIQKHIEFFLKGDADLLETMHVLENQLINYCEQVGRVDDLIVYYNDEQSGDSAEGDDAEGDEMNHM